MLKIVSTKYDVLTPLITRKIEEEKHTKKVEIF